MAVGRHLEYCGCPQELHILENIQLFKEDLDGKGSCQISSVYCEL